MKTPWGQSQTEEVIAEGLVYYTTASHGGIHLSKKRMEAILKEYPDFQSWCGSRRWLEEACDYYYAVVCFPELFPEKTVKAAVKHFLAEKRYIPEPALKIAFCPIQVCYPSSLDEKR